MLELSQLDVYYAKNHVLKGVTLRVNDGEVVALVGANAAGKTTTLRTIMGLKAPTGGSIVLRGWGLIAQPKCLLLDEPTLGLAPLIVEEIIRIVRELAAKGITVLLAEQNAAMALAVADRAYVLETGRVSLEGTGAALANDEAVRQNYLGT